MSCYFRHMKDIFDEAGVEPTPENKKEIDRFVHDLVGVPYKDCPAAWRAIKGRVASEGGREDLVSRLKEKA